MSKDFIATATRLIVASLIVGTILAVVGADPITLWKNAWHWTIDSVEYVFGKGWNGMVSAARYTVLGAAVVLPIWFVSVLFKRRKQSTADARSGE